MCEKFKILGFVDLPELPAQVDWEVINLPEMSAELFFDAVKQYNIDQVHILYVQKRVEKIQPENGQLGYKNFYQAELLVSPRGLDNFYQRNPQLRNCLEDS